MTIDFEEQRKLDTEELKLSLNEIKEVNIMKSQDTSVFKPLQIDSKDLTPCSMGPGERNSSYLCKRMYKFEEVACKEYNIKDDPKKKQKSYNPKIANFDVARKQNTTTSEIPDLKKVVRWMAPEKIKGEPYTTPWNDNPNHRMGVGELYVRLENLAEKYVKPGDLPIIFDNNEIDFDGSKFYGDDGGDMEFLSKRISELNFNLCDVEIKEPTPLSEDLAKDLEEVRVIIKLYPYPLWIMDDNRQTISHVGHSLQNLKITN
ncbi:20067_t:CDS:2, partial [Racocetra fulgida]